jgi:hypothetical protein
MQCLEYDEASNAWSYCTNPYNSPIGHGYDHDVVDPATGDHYWRAYGATSAVKRYYRWNGSNWTEIANNPCENADEITAGMAWDSNRGGIIAHSDSGGVAFWSKSTNTWTCLVKPLPGISTSNGYHYLAEFNPSNNLVWLQDHNGSNLHWRLNTINTVTSLATPPTTLGCCGSNGRLTAYDSRTKKFIVADPFNNTWWEYDIATDSWIAFPNSLPLDNGKYDQSNVEGFVTVIPAYGTILYVMARGTGTPQAYLYKH